MRIKKFIISIILVFLAISSLALNSKVFGENETSDEFSGTRTFTIYSDLSNLKNYIEGGRPSLEYIIRSKNKDWLNLEISSTDVDLQLDFSFKFNSFEDYTNKLNELLTFSPTIINEEGRYIEGFSTRELVNYLKDELQINGLYVSDTEDIELFKGGDSKIIFSDEVQYEAKNERISFGGDSDVLLKLDRLSINTTYNKENNTFDRTIEFEIGTESDKALNSMKKSFIKRCEKEKVEYKNDEVKKFVVNFSKNTEKELSETTMIILNVSSNIELKEQYDSGNKIEIIFSEYIDLDGLLNEEASYLYTFDISNFEKVKLIDGYNENEGFSLEENILKIEEPKSTIKFSYKKDFEFDKIEVITDFTNDWNITRTIRMRARTIIVKDIHDNIKESITNAVPDGVTLNIYDEGAYRYYDIVFSGNVNKINSITSKITDGESKLSVSQMLLPFMPSKVNDNITVEQICTYVKEYKNISQKYIFSKDTKLPNEKELDVEKTENNVIVTYPNGNVSLTYKNFDKILFSKVLILVIIVIIVILIIRHKIKKFIKRIKEKRAIKKLEKAKKKKGEKSGE